MATASSKLHDNTPPIFPTVVNTWFTAIFLPVVYRVVENDTQAFTALQKANRSNLLNFTNIYPHLPCFYVIGVDVKCIAMQYIK